MATRVNVQTKTFRNKRVFPILATTRLHRCKRLVVGVSLVPPNQLVVDVNRVAIMLSVASLKVSRLINFGSVVLVGIYIRIQPNAVTRVMSMVNIISEMFVAMMFISVMVMAMFLIRRTMMAMAEMKMRF